MCAKTTTRPGRGARGEGPDRRGVRSQKGPRVAAKALRPPKDPTVCDGCGAVYTRKLWHAESRLSRARMDEVSWGRCPACDQKRQGVGYGRVVLTGTFVGENLDAIRRRIKNVAERAKATQTQRRVVSYDATDDGLEVITTSQKLAHRIVREIEKAFGGKARYSWASRDGSLFASWHRDR
jgi:NMD protein affecting ribosome stability and mRNA decay